MNHSKARVDELRRELERLAPGDDDPELSVAFLRAVMAHVPAHVTAIDPEGRFLFVNRTIPGIAMSDVLGKTVFDFMPEDAHATAREAFQRVLATGEPDGYIGYGPGRAGPRSPYQNWVSPIRSGDEVIALALITRDVSDEWAVQRALADRQERLGLALQAAGMGMFRYDAATRTTELDERAQSIYGIDHAVFVADEFDRHIHPEDLDRVTTAARVAMATGEPYHAESRIIRQDGSIGWISGHGVGLYDEAGRLHGMLGTIVDITERRELEDQLRQAQKLEAVGQLTAGIAHNFNNMLASIIPTLELVGSKATGDDAVLIASAREAAGRAAQMVRELLTFAGRNRPCLRRREDPRALIERTMRICRTTFDRGITLDVEQADELPAFDVDAAQIEQALLNILINARDALRSSGTPEPVVRVVVDLARQPSFCVRFRITDNGPGMSTDVSERIFEPFFTTKEVGEGTGLGLSTAYAIVREHGGSISCESAPGCGTTIAVIIPCGGMPSVGAHDDAFESDRPRGSGSILVVDDEHVVRTVVERVLADAGYAVRGARDGVEAVAAAGAEPFDIVLLDLNMPGLPWREVVAALRAARPSVKIVAYTGKGVSDELDGVDEVLRKPADPAAICEAIARVLQ